MTHRPTRSPASDLERAAHSIAKGRSPDALRELARNAGLDDEHVSRGENSPSEGVGTLDSRIVVLGLPRERVEKLLPLGLELAPQTLTFPDKHPVFVMFSHDHFEAWFGEMDYNELMVAVPYVQRTALHVANRGPFVYMPRLYLDEDLPRRLGNLLYGFEKELGNIANGPDSYTVRNRDNDQLIASATFAEAGTPQPPSSLPLFQSVRKLFEMPTISQALRIVDDEAFDERDFVSPFLACTVCYDFSDATATVQPLTATVEFTTALTPPGLPPGPIAVPSLDTEVLGAFRLRCNQVVSLPGSCADARFHSPSPPRKEKVVVLGGGPSALAAAYYLARQVDRYEVEVYSVGWRLGGKCAAGRNTTKDDRIEEHGLHAFVGFYENGFRTMREAWEDAGLQIEVGQAPYNYNEGQGPVAGAFIGCEDVGVFQKWKDEWRYFATPQEFNGKIPGEVPEGGEDPEPNLGNFVSSALRRVVQDTEVLLRHNRAEEARFEAEKEPNLWERIAADVKDFVDLETKELRNGLDELVSYVERLAVDAIADQIERGTLLFRIIASVLEMVRSALKTVLEDFMEDEPEVYFVWQGLDILLTALVGLIHAKTVHFDALDGHDFRQWLLDNGLDERNRDAAAITQVYETLFAHGETATPDQLAAGVGLRWFVLVSFLYKGYPAYFFKYSCPQTMITPYYLALQRFGAKVHFFHQVTDLVVEGTGDERRLAGVKMQVQATTEDGTPYDPFVRIPGNPPSLPSWPTEPRYDKLSQGQALRDRGINLESPWSGWEGVGEKLLELGKDFDHCILGIPVSVFPAIAKQLTESSSPSHAPQWRSMVDGMKVIRTISAQLWFQQPMDQLTTNPYGMLTSYALPEPSLGDFTHLLQWEPWGKTDGGPKSLSYHTGSLTAITTAQGYPNARPNYPTTESDQWRSEFGGWLQEHYRGIFDSIPSYEDMLSNLAAPDGVEGQGRLDAQYFNISSHPSDHYVLSQPNAIGLRLGQTESWVQGLVLCGDWTRTDLNCGCVEASTQSGMLASRALSNEPRYIWHPGF
ncbi:MAG: NAD(P)-binding protein [Nannocystales bacterium]